jgi:hypothetical protein
MGQVTAAPQAIDFLPTADRSGRQWRSPGSGGANWLASSAGATPDIPDSRMHVGGFLSRVRPEPSVADRTRSLLRGLWHGDAA